MLRQMQTKQGVQRLARLKKTTILLEICNMVMASRQCVNISCSYVLILRIGLPMCSLVLQSGRVSRSSQ